MIEFSYTARDDDGYLKKGTIVARDKIEAQELLSDKGLIPIALKSSKRFSLAELFQKSVPAKTVIMFTRQFAIMFESGVPVLSIISTLIRQAQHRILRVALVQVKEDLQHGKSLSDSFAKHPQVFNKVYINMIKIGEASGSLTQVLRELARLLERNDRVKKQIKSATIYPKIVLGTTVLVFISMMLFVMPVFQKFYSSRDIELPIPTQIMIGISHMMTTYWPIFLLLMIGSIFSVLSFKKSEAGEVFFDWLAYRTPVIGNLYLLSVNSRFGHMVGAMYSSGVPLTRALGLVSNAVGSCLFTRDIDVAREMLEDGVSLSETMAGSKYFLPLMAEVAHVGERTGAIDTLLKTTASFLDEEIEEHLTQLQSLIEPLLLFFVFAIIGFFAMAIFLPIWNLSTVAL